MKTKKELEYLEHSKKFILGYEACKEDVLRLINKIPKVDEDFINTLELKARIEGKSLNKMEVKNGKHTS